MTSSGRDLPKEVIEHWPEVFGEVKLNVVPLRYLQTVMVNFIDGRTWEIRVTEKTKKDGWDSFEKNLAELFKSYETKINNIDFKLDTNRVKKDIEKSTGKFLKKRTI